MGKEKLKNLPVKASVHERIVACAKQRGMTIQGLTERILRAWIDVNFFDKEVANGNIASERGVELNRTKAERKPAMPENTMSSLTERCGSYMEREIDKDDGMLCPQQ